jgi:hypothetical protein
VITLLENYCTQKAATFIELFLKSIILDVFKRETSKIMLKKMKRES